MAQSMNFIQYKRAGVLKLIFNEIIAKKGNVMTRILQEKLSKLREDLIQNKQKETLINISVHELSMIITGLKMSNDFDDILDEEIEIKHNRSMKNKLNRKS